MSLQSRSIGGTDGLLLYLAVICVSGTLVPLLVRTQNAINCWYHYSDGKQLGIRPRTREITPVLMLQGSWFGGQKKVGDGFAQSN